MRYERAFRRQMLFRWSGVRPVIIPCSCLVFALLAAGCSPASVEWRPLDQPTHVKRSHVVAIWSHGAVKAWHAVVITQDSISGIPYDMSLTCDSCRRSLPRSLVDSVQLAYQGQYVDSKEVLEVAGATAVIILLDFLLEAAASTPHGCC